jgi:hypothetical protein
MPRPDKPTPGREPAWPMPSVMGYPTQSFGEVVFVVRSGFRSSRLMAPYIAKEAPDLVIEELIERHLPSVAESGVERWGEIGKKGVSWTLKAAEILFLDEEEILPAG